MAIMNRILAAMCILGSLQVTAQDGSVVFSPVEGRDWDMKVVCSGPEKPAGATTLTVKPVERIAVKREWHGKLRLFDEKKAGWLRGERLDSLRARECSISDALVPESVCVEDEKGRVYKAGVDYQLEPRWAAVGRLREGAIGEDTPVWISYEYYPLRLDSIVLEPDGRIVQKPGLINGATPLPPALEPGERLLGNLFFEKRPEKLSDDMLFPVTAKRPDAFPDVSNMAAERLPKTLAKLRNNETVRILAWGDSVTDMGYLPKEKRWINSFAAELQRRFPKAKIELVNLGWPGKRAETFFNRPAGDCYNYEEKVLASGADLVTIEFVNDAKISEKSFETVYGRVASDFKKAGFEVIVLVPHYVRPDWMNLNSQKNIDVDPRPYSQLLRRWAEANNFALADVAARYGQLWRDGIPYNTLMLNSINHPDERGSKLFVEALLSLFPEK